MALQGIPGLLNKFNLYTAGQKFIGITGEVTLPDFESMTATVSGAGYLGEVDMPVIGMYGSIEMEIPFRVLDTEAFKLVDPSKSVELTLRGSLQYQDGVNQNIDTKGIRIVVRGLSKKLTGGSANQGNPMNSSITLELTYYMIEVDGQQKIELDKPNFVFKVNGVDKLAKIKAQI